MVSQFLGIYAGLLWLLTVALHALVAQPVQDGAALVADGGARLVVMLHPGVRPPSHLRTPHTIQHWPMNYTPLCKI